ncbi:MAG: NADH-quinone oxidoreductase subunit N [Chitinophagaceae bacterium]|nr:NADH-quinone oxidoreductase subunit N [Chitinophagaceae bacterium]
MLNEYLQVLKSEWLILAIIFILLFIKVGSKEWKNESLLYFINFLLLINLIAGFINNLPGSLFNGMYLSNDLIFLQKNILNLGVYLISLIAYPWLKEHKHLLEFYILMLSTLLGMFFMISSGNLLIFYLGLELSTIPLAALANFDLEKRKSSEAAMKLIISSAFSSAILLFGISLLYGVTGSLFFYEIAPAIHSNTLNTLIFILILAGFSFKISVVPFHLWTADVYEGAPVPVTAYLSVISKSAILFIFMTVLYSVFRNMETQWYFMIFLLSVFTILIGNLFAIRQNNLKRFLAFSSIAQVGFILLGLSGSSKIGMASVIYFLVIYLFSNLAAFGVVGLVSATTGKESIEDFKGFYKTNPFLSWVLAIALFSLAGVPPTAGFFGKFFLIMAGAERGNYVWIIFAALNMIISFYYYLRIVKAIFMDQNNSPIPAIKTPPLPKLAMVICLIGTISVGFLSWVYEYIFSFCNF